MAVKRKKTTIVHICGDDGKPLCGFLKAGRRWPKFHGRVGLKNTERANCLECLDEAYRLRRAEEEKAVLVSG